MDGVIGKARECKASPGQKHLDLVGGSELSDAIEDVGGLVPGQHSNWFWLYSVTLCLCGDLASLVSAPHLDASKPRRRRAMARAHHLLRLALAAIRCAPQRPLIAGADSIDRIPELSGD